MEQGKQKPGKIILNDVRLMKHEHDTVLYFARMGKEVELIKPSYTPGRKNADFVMDGVEWEMKAPSKNNRRAVERTFYEASRQAENVVFDLRRMAGNEIGLIRILERSFTQTRRVRRFYLITGNGELKMYRK